MLPFTSSAPLTLGVELELQLIEPESGDLAPSAQLLLARLPNQERIKPELFKSIIEINTGICKTVPQARRDLERSLAQMRAIAGDLGVEIMSAGSHPFARYEERQLYPSERYEAMMDRHRWLLRRMQIYGLHIHIGMPDGETAMAVINGWLRYMPHMLALSASSPFWEGRDTGLASCRTSIFEALPISGVPCLFDDWAHFSRYFDKAIASQSIRGIKDIWWDIRPHPDFGTIELRICDAPATLRELAAVVALAHALSARLLRQVQEEDAAPRPEDWIVRENKWRSSRWGLEARIIGNNRGAQVRIDEELLRLADELADDARALGCAKELADVPALLRAGASYQRQRRWLEQTQDYKAVIGGLLREFETDQLLPELPAPRAVAAR